MLMKRFARLSMASVGVREMGRESEGEGWRERGRESGREGGGERDGG
jgi:hypothetical protein